MIIFAKNAKKVDNAHICNKKRLLSLTEQYRAVWLSRYQPGGMQVRDQYHAKSIGDETLVVSFGCS